MKINNPEITTAFSAAMAHITEADSQMLEASMDSSMADDGVLTFYNKSDYGYLIIVDKDHFTPEAIRKYYSQHLVDLMQITIDLGAKWLDLDVDGPEYPELPNFDW